MPGGALEGGEQPSRVRYWVRVHDRLPDDAAGAPGVAHLHQRHDPARSVPGAARRDPQQPDGAGRLAGPHHLVPPACRADEWLLYDQVSPWAGGARGLSLGRMFATDGTLVASMAQEGLIRPRR